mgnify:CR=1 FL=1
MASAAFRQFQYSLLAKRVDLWAVVAVGAAGAVTLKQWSYTTGGAAGSYGNAQTSPADAFSPIGTQGIKSVTKEATAGQWTWVFQNSYQRLLGVDVTCMVATTGISAAPDIGVISTTPAVASNPGTFVTALSLNGVAANPASGELLVVHFTLDDSDTP